MAGTGLAPGWPRPGRAVPLPNPQLASTLKEPSFEAVRTGDIIKSAVLRLE